MVAPAPTVISYADTTIGAVFFNIPLPLEANKINRYQTILSAALQRHESPAALQEYKNLLLNYLDTYHHSLMLHEFFHILQAITYPGVYLQCVRELKLVHGILGDLRHSDKPEISIRNMLPYQWEVTLLLPSTVCRITIGEDGTYAITPNPEDHRPNDLTVNDLLEGDVSIFQYKVEIDGPGSGEGFSQWLKERRRYTMAFNFLARLLGPANAYIALPPLVRAAFSTNRPMSTFAGLVAMTVAITSGLPELFGIDDYFELLLDRIAESPHLTRHVPDINDSGSQDADIYFDRSTFSQLIEASPEHPLYALAHDLWEDCGENRRQPDWIFHPYRYFDRRNEKLPEQLKAYLPPLIVLRPFHPTLSLDDSLLITAPRFVNKPFPLSPTATYLQVFYEYMCQKYVAYSLATNIYDTYPHNCSHQDCPVFPTNLCRRWIRIPKDFQGCDFPEDFQEYTGYRIEVSEGLSRLVKLKGAK